MTEMLTLWITILAKIHQDCFSICFCFLVCLVYSPLNCVQKLPQEPSKTPLPVFICSLNLDSNTITAVKKLVTKTPGQAPFPLLVEF